MDKQIFQLLTQEKNLTAEEEKLVFLYYRDHHTRDVRNLIVEKNLGLCRYLVSKFPAFEIDTEELEQEAVIGLITAIDKFDPERGNKFSTYAVPWIEQVVRRYIHNHSRSVRLPVHINERLYKIRRLQNNYIRENGNPPSMEYLSAESGLDLQTVMHILALAENTRVLSLNAPIVTDSEDSSEWEEIIPAEDNFTEDVERTVDGDRLWEAIKTTLTEKEYRILRQRIGADDGIPQTLDKLGKKYGVTRERIRQIEKASIAKIRNLKECKTLEKCH